MIVSTVHTDIDMFIYSQPSLEHVEGEPWFVMGTQRYLPRLFCQGRADLPDCKSKESPICYGLHAGQLVVHAHCYLHRPSLVPFGHRIPLAPQYLLKLKSAEAIALASHLFISSISAQTPGELPVHVTPAACEVCIGMHAHLVSKFV